MARLGINGFKLQFRKAVAKVWGRYARRRTCRFHENTLDEIRRGMARLAMLRERIKAIVACPMKSSAASLSSSRRGPE